MPQHPAATDPATADPSVTDPSATDPSATTPPAGARLPRVAITLGDVAGIGPEIVVRLLADPAVQAATPALVIGPLAAVQRAAALWGARAGSPQGLRIEAITDAAQFTPRAGVIAVLDTGTVPDDLPWGRVDARAGAAAYAAILRGIDLAMAGSIDALCTAPIHKEALAAAGVAEPGHTEILALRSGSTDTAMMLVNPALRTMLVTIHCALSEAIGQITQARELRIIRLAHRTLQSMGIAQPRIAVAGLNPHAGEGGLFGHEDRDIIAPAIAQARAEGIDASGPHPGDTVFMQARRGRYDLVVAQYHDQGLIPIKLLGVEDGVNVTAGLPFVRTSPDHGTAFDIAGRGQADPASLHAALVLAHRMAARN